MTIIKKNPVSFDEKSEAKFNLNTDQNKQINKYSRGQTSL